MVKRIYYADTMPPTSLTAISPAYSRAPDEILSALSTSIARDG